MIAAWPGMGNVALIAASYLIQELGMTQGDELPPGDHFEVSEIAAKDGLVQPVRQPRGLFFHWKNPGESRDLVVFISEAQPSTGGIAYAEKLLSEARRLGVERIVTFASLASGLHPSQNPKVSGVATDDGTLELLRRAEVEPIPDGEIGGMNGLLLGVAARDGFPGIGLLAEIPFFAMRVPNPKAARAALSVFSVLAGIDISLESIDRQAAVVDQALIEAMEQIEAQGEGGDTSDTGEASDTTDSGERSASGEGDEGREPGDADNTGAPAPSDKHPDPDIPAEPPIRSPDGRVIDPASIANIERLFDAAKRDPNEAVKLKAELDRLGIFKRYEGRFLDLFKRAG